AAVEDGAAIAELGGDVDLDGEAGKLFDQVLADQGGVPGGAAGDEAEAVEAGGVAILEAELWDADVGRLEVQAFAHGVAEGLGLLEDFFEHEVGVAGLFGGLAVPGDGGRAAAKGRPVERAQGDAVGGQDGELALVEDEDLAGLAEQGGDVGGDEHLAAPVADDEGGAAAAEGDEGVRGGAGDTGDGEGAAEVAGGAEPGG